MDSSKKVGVKLMVDTEKSRVVLAESGADFVDILFSFLTMPLGTVIRVLENKSTSWSGSFVNIYQSVADLDTRYFWTEACKTMLLRPRNSAWRKCEGLAVKIDDIKPRRCYACEDCRAKSECLVSSIPGTRCSCGQVMTEECLWGRLDEKAGGDGVFVNGELVFSITDDLNVATPSTALLMRMLETMEIEYAGKLEERNLELGLDEVASLLWRSLMSTSPLTGICFNTPAEDAPARGQMKDDVIQPKHESESSDADCSSKEIKLKLVVDKQRNKVVYAEADEDMVDLLFGWLTFPLGLIAKHAKNMPRGCIGNLSKSLECHGLVRSECKSMLLAPKLAPFHGCSSQLLDADEIVYEYNQLLDYVVINPKSPNNGSTEVGGGFARASMRYMVTDDLRVLPFTQHSFVQILGELMVPTDSIVAMDVSLGATQALDLLRAAFASRTPLSDVFPQVKKHRGCRCSVVQ